ncbi:Fur family transcriptional regulator [Alicyclobacillus sp. SO9]|uniref:Fur family transcriptional regulator n=1 Tax=Alicyclobacillus sp. SO9 TaxID=2665646 RepID=UPI0018E80A24|nr:Fur family transcriptional regulator [Alicyclobacillus sp. SO9]QQE78680.1 transcriptional repressor [Alicyclobacillus sp. SO9]
MAPSRNLDNTAEKPDVSGLLKDAGLRITPQRSAILELMQSLAGEHFSAQQVYESIHTTHPSMSVATVYKTLRSLTEAGLIREIRNGDGASLFDGNTEPHHHMVCRKCGKRIDFYVPANVLNLDDAASHARFRLEEVHIELTGLCSDCAAQ